jgi:DNA-binding GntR family transcriptional regulator
VVESIRDMSTVSAVSGHLAPRRRTSDRVLAQLRRMIITLELPPGAVVTEENLCALLECSRTPLREALRALAREHLVVSVPHHGVSIAELSITDFSALAEAMEGVGCFLSELAAERITEEQLALMEELTAASATATDAGDLAQAAELDFRFHQVLAEAAGNRFMIEVQDTLHRLIMRFTFLGFRRAGTAAGAVADHRQIIEALRSGDPHTAAEAMHHHMHDARERMLAAL